MTGNGPTARACAWVLAALAPLLLVGGCPSPGGLDGGGGSSDGLSLDDAPNATLDTAAKVPLSDSDQATFSGRISTAGDLDFFDLGTLTAGDRVQVDVQRGGSLDPVAAIFDERAFVHAYNDDRDLTGNDLSPLIDIVIRGATGPYFLGIVGFPGASTTGDYEVTVSITRGAGLQPAPPQVIFLNWEGGSDVVIPNVGRFDLPPFDSLELGFIYAGQTALIRDLVENGVADRFAGFNLTVLNSDDDPIPAAPFSTIYFGGEDQLAFAISEQIDTFNADRSDDAIIFTGSFRGAFSGIPTTEQMGTALANTVAHEIGHLLGLVHTAECAELMDTSCGNDSLLVEQAFFTAPLDDSVFPTGEQSAVELLEWTLALVGL